MGKEFYFALAAGCCIYPQLATRCSFQPKTQPIRSKLPCCCCPEFYLTLKINRVDK